MQISLVLNKAFKKVKILNILRGEPNLCSTAFGRKDFRIISFQTRDANFQKTEFNKGILNLDSSLQVLQQLIQNQLLDYQFSTTARCKFSEDRIQRRYFQFSF